MSTRIRWITCVVAIMTNSLFAKITTEETAATTQAATQVAAEVGEMFVFRMHGPLHEAPAPFDFGFKLEPKRSLHDLLDRLKKAQKDKSVKAVVLTFDQPMIGWAQSQELCRAMRDLLAADKDVYCYLEEAMVNTYLLAAGASRICIVPTGEIWLTGLHVEQPYLKDLLDKIGIEADIEHIGAYKGAGEPLMRTEPSEEAKEMLDWLVGDLFDQMVQTVAESRAIPPDAVRALIDRGPFTATQAHEAGLVDEVAYAEQFVESLQERYGKNVTMVHNYGAKKGPDIDFSNPFAIFKFFGQAMSKRKASAKPSIAVIYVDGIIVTGKTEEGVFRESGLTGSTTVRRALNEAAQDDQIKAVVLRVDSPGGSALASDIIWHATREVALKKPLIVSMGNIAASGGYYVSAGAHTIFADPATITGSIGVVGGKLVTKGFWDWVGVNFYEKSFGQNADLLNTNRKFDDRQRALLRQYMQEVYDAFTDRVIEGRKNRLKKSLHELAGGRVYTGQQAQANGLVDKLGGLQDAIKFAANQANISKYDIRVLPAPKNFFDFFFKGMAEDEDADNVGVRWSSSNRGWTLKAPGLSELLKMLRQVEPARVQMVLRSLMRIELLANERALLITPSEIRIH